MGSHGRAGLGTCARDRIAPGATAAAAAQKEWERRFSERQDPTEIEEAPIPAASLVDGRMLFVVYTMREDVVRIISARGAEPHEKRKYHEI